MSSIIEQIANIFKTAKPSSLDSCDLYDEQTSQQLDELIPEFVDDNRTTLLKAVRYVLKLNEDDELEFLDARLKLKRAKSEIIIETPKSDILDDMYKDLDKSLDSDENSTDKKSQDKADEGPTTLKMPLSDILLELGLSGVEVNNDVKDKIRNYVRIHTNLYEKDMILILNDQVIIKRFNRQAEVKQEEQRYNGLPPEELNIMRAKIFDSTDAEEKFMAEVMKKTMAIDLNFAVIGGDNFQKNYVKKIQKHIQMGLAELINEDQFVLEGLGNLVLRENWILAHKLMARRLLDLVGEKVTGAESFLRYFKGDVVLGDDGHRYRLPEIIDINGVKWSVSMMFGMVLQQSKAKVHKQQLEVATKEIKTKMDDCMARMAVIEKETQKAREDIAETEREMAEMYDTDQAREMTLKNLNLDIQNAKSPEETQALKARYMELMGEMKRAVSKEYNLKAKKKSFEDIIQTSASRINKLKQELTVYDRKLKEEETKINKFVASLKALNEKYNIMVDALVGALMKRKTKVTEL